MLEAMAFWIDAPGTWPIATTNWLDVTPPADGLFYRIVASALPQAAPPQQQQAPDSQKRELQRQLKARRYSGLLLDDGISGRSLRIPSR